MGPAGSESAVAARVAGFNGFVRDVPGAAVDYESRFHDQRIAEKKENGKWKFEERNWKSGVGKSPRKELKNGVTEKRKYGEYGIH
jgi:hypothetical protein